jgi:phosphoglycolate phosphatase
MKSRFDLIIFDWDGTLVDSVDWIVHCIQQAAAHCSCPVPESQAVKDIIGLSIENAVKQLFPDTSSSLRQQLANHYAQSFFSKPMALFPGVKFMLQQLRQEGFQLAIATGKKTSGLALAIEAAGVGELFCTTRCSDQTASKPDPLMINEIVAELGSNKRRTLMVGDSTHDLQMAMNAGVASIGLTCGAHSATTPATIMPGLSN